MVVLENIITWLVANRWELIGFVLGVIGVRLMIRQNILGWPVGLVQVAVYTWVFFDARLYSDAILQVAFFLIQAYGWWHWWRGKTPSRELPVTQIGNASAAGAVVAGLVVTVGWGMFMHRTTDAALPYWDAFILIFSLIAQWLQARKKLECWPGWVLVNTIAIGVYWVKDLHLTAVLYVIFWLMALWGWREWSRSLKGVKA